MTYDSNDVHVPDHLGAHHVTVGGGQVEDFDFRDNTHHKNRARPRCSDFMTVVDTIYIADYQPNMQ